MLAQWARAVLLGAGVPRTMGEGVPLWVQGALLALLQTLPLLTPPALMLAWAAAAHTLLPCLDPRTRTPHIPRSPWVPRTHTGTAPHMERAPRRVMAPRNLHMAHRVRVLRRGMAPRTGVVLHMAQGVVLRRGGAVAPPWDRGAAPQPP